MSRSRSHVRVLVAAAVLAALLPSLTGCASRQVSGLQFSPQPGWLEESGEDAVRVARYRLPGTEPDGSRDAELILYYFGPAGAGSVPENLERWRSHFTSPEEDAEAPFRVTSDERKGLQFDGIEVEGIYVAPLRPGTEDRHFKPAHRMLATVVSTDAGPYYVRLVGPDETVERWKRSYLDFLRSMRPAPIQLASVEPRASHP